MTKTVILSVLIAVFLATAVIDTVSKIKKKNREEK